MYFQNNIVFPFSNAHLKESFPICFATLASLEFYTIPLQTNDVSFKLTVLKSHCCVKYPYFSKIIFLYSAFFSVANLQLHFSIRAWFFALRFTTPTPLCPKVDTHVSNLLSPSFFSRFHRQRMFLLILSILFITITGALNRDMKKIGKEYKT